MAIDVSGTTAIISDATTAILYIISAFMGLSVSILGVGMVYKFLSREAGISEDWSGGGVRGPLTDGDFGGTEELTEEQFDDFHAGLNVSSWDDAVDTSVDAAPTSDLGFYDDEGEWHTPDEWSDDLEWSEAQRGLW